MRSHPPLTPVGAIRPLGNRRGGLDKVIVKRSPRTRHPTVHVLSFRVAASIVVVGLGSFSILPVAGSAVAASRTSRPVVVTASRPRVSAGGGLVTLRATVKKTDKVCTWSPSPSIRGFSATVKCGANLSRVAQIPTNLSTKPRRFTFSLATANDKIEQSAKAVVVQQGRSVTFTSPTIVSTDSPIRRDVFGLYAGPGNVAGVNEVATMLGHDPAYVSDFITSWSWATISSDNSDWIPGVGDPPLTSLWSPSNPYTMVWSLPMLPNPASGGGPDTLAAGAAGTYNAYFTRLASNLSAAGWNSKNCIIRLGPEFNGNWEYWWAPAGQEANFVTYWRNIVTAMRAVIPGLKFIWSPNIGNNWGSSALENYYPGSAYVNYVGLDVYDTTSGNNSTTWNSYLTMSYGLNWLARFSATTGKPLCIPEFGLGPPAGSKGGGDDPDFIARIAAWVSANSPTGYVSIWDPTEGSLATTWAVPSGTSAPNSNDKFVNLFHYGSQ